MAIPKVALSPTELVVVEAIRVERHHGRGALYDRIAASLGISEAFLVARLASVKMKLQMPTATTTQTMEALFGPDWRGYQRGLGNWRRKPEWLALLESTGGGCYYCGAIDKPLIKEHKIPRMRGGPNTWDNIVPACQLCNLRKMTRTDTEFIAMRKPKTA